LPPTPAFITAEEEFRPIGAQKTLKALASSSPGFALKPWVKDASMKFFATLKGLRGLRRNPFQGCNEFNSCALTQGCNNPGLELANAFSVKRLCALFTIRHRTIHRFITCPIRGPYHMKQKLLLTTLFVCLLSTNVEPKSRRAPRRAAASVTTPSGLTYLITKKGTGRMAKAGETVVLHYTGTLTNGVKFDSSRDRNQPFTFKLGAGRVIKGYDEGLSKLHIGDQVILVIPPALGYGAKGAGGVIPPNATLIFIVELLDIKAKSLSDVLSKTLTEKGVEAMIAEFRSLRKSGAADLYASESDLNTFGYSLLRKKQVNEAIEVFKLNVEAYPQSANVYDSLGEAYLLRGDKEKAIENYRKSLELDPNSENAKEVLKKLKGE
jgi:peptidylprolyl isomerase